MIPKLVSALLVCSVLLGGAVAGAPITEQNSRLNASADASFGEDVVEVEQNGTATIPVVFDGNDTATVKIGSEAVNYILIATVTDGDGDGKVTLRFDTAAAETDEESVWVNDSQSSGDAVTVRSEMNPDDPPLAVGSYPLSLYAGNTTAEDAEIGVATMAVVSAETTTERGTEVRTTVVTPTEESTQSTTATETETQTTGGPDSGLGVPGFGVGAAVAALSGAALLASRR